MALFTQCKLDCTDTVYPRFQASIQDDQNQNLPYASYDNCHAKFTGNNMLIFAVEQKVASNFGLTPTYSSSGDTIFISFPFTIGYHPLDGIQTTIRYRKAGVLQASTAGFVIITRISGSYVDGFCESVGVDIDGNPWSINSGQFYNIVADLPPGCTDVLDCQNGGTFNTVTCQCDCPAGYSGTLCETYVGGNGYYFGAILNSTETLTPTTQNLYFDGSYYQFSGDFIRPSNGHLYSIFFQATSQDLTNAHFQLPAGTLVFKDNNTNVTYATTNSQIDCSDFNQVTHEVLASFSFDLEDPENDVQSLQGSLFLHY